MSLDCLNGCFKGLYGCFNCASKGLQGCFMAVSRLLVDSKGILLGIPKGVSKVFQANNIIKDV